MSAYQRHAWFNLGVLATTVVLYLMLSPYLGWQRATGAVGLLGLWGLGPIFFMRRDGGVLTDERDRMIQRRSVVASYAVFWLLFVATAMGLWLRYRAHEAISPDALPALVLGGLIVFVLVQSITTLLLYGFEDAHE